MRRLVAFAFVMLVAPAAAAAPSESKAIEEAARARYAEGLKLYGKKRYEEARVAFFQASALLKRPSATLMLAQSALRSGHWLEAARNFDDFLATTNEIPDKVRVGAEKGLREAKSHLGALKLDIPDGAEATVDGEKVDVKAPITVAAGQHTVVVTHRDETKTIEVDAPAGKVTDVRPNFVPKAIIPTADTRTRPKEAAVTTSQSATAESEESRLFTPPTTTWPMYAAGAIGVGGLVTAAIFGGLAANARHGVEVANETLARNARPGASCSRPASFDDPAKGQTIEEFQETCDTLATQQRWASTHQGVFTTSLVIGLAGFAGAITWFLVAPRPGGDAKEKGAESVVVPWVGPMGAGASWSGSF
ncbi:MAG: hypothetical protein KIT84_26635 [Labilithrix sp.]|nr:hypothetical protein [Labilithrix sp.]MCW5814631.1 hypothetical protein [Labilithrix sp.]